jgi:hypothetical protein
MNLPYTQDQRRCVTSAAGFPRPTNRVLFRFFALAVFGCSLAAAPRMAAQIGTGAIEGRIQNVATGNYLNHARVAIKGTTLSR